MLNSRTLIARAGPWGYLVLSVNNLFFIYCNTTKIFLISRVPDYEKNALFSRGSAVELRSGYASLATSALCSNDDGRGVNFEATVRSA
jgi:hypothetical protein